MSFSAHSSSSSSSATAVMNLALLVTSIPTPATWKMPPKREYSVAGVNSLFWGTDVGALSMTLPTIVDREPTASTTNRAVGSRANMFLMPTGISPDVVAASMINTGDDVLIAVGVVTGPE